jgi:hypothetical protein
MANINKRRVADPTSTVELTSTTAKRFCSLTEKGDDIGD